MAQNAPISRRELLNVGACAVAGIVAHKVGADESPAPACSNATVAQTAGPYYPTRSRDDEDPDLTQVHGRPGRALGDVLFVRGRVLDEACQPIAGALVEIWQANTWGRYDHERDAGNPRPLDPNFQSWAEMLTDSQGQYRFKTVKPGSYPADDKGWVRPPHIHFRVSRRGFHELITQMYFTGEQLNDADLIRQKLTPEERDQVTIAFQPAPAEPPAGARLGEFDITLRQVG